MQKDDINIYETNDISDEILYMDKITLHKGEEKEIIFDDKIPNSEPNIYVVTKGKISIMNDTLVNGKGFSIDENNVKIVALEDSNLVKINVRKNINIF